MKIVKVGLIVIGCVFIVCVIVFGIYLITHRQGVIESSEIGDTKAEKRILIASQGSSFKYKLVENLTADLKEKPFYIKVIDVTSLEEINEADWDATVIICTFEKWKIQPDAQAYLARAKELDKIVLVVTSGSGKGKTEEYDVDAFTSASKEEELNTLRPMVLKKLQSILEK